MIEIFNNLEEIQKYYDKETNTYIFKENDIFIDTIIFNFTLEVNANIRGGNIRAWDIKAFDIRATNISCSNIMAIDIDARNIDALNITAKDIIALNIDALNITARNINVDNIFAKSIDVRGEIDCYDTCVASEYIKCKSIIGGQTDD